MSLNVELSLESISESGEYQPSKGELKFLLREWNQFMNHLGEEHHPALIQLANRLGLPAQAKEMSSDTAKIVRCIEGLLALGYLQDDDAWEIAYEAAQSDQPYLSIVGCQTLVRLDPERGIPILLRKYTSTEAFPASEASSMLKLARPETVTDLLLEELEEENRSGKIRIAKLLEAGDPGEIRPIIHNLLEESDSDDELIADLLDVLGSFGHPADESLLIPYTDHSSEPVRLKAVKALGNVGTSESTVPLTNALGDANWWVRYRAAESLTKIPDITPDWLKKTMNNHDDPYAQDIMERVMVERNLI